MKLKILLGVLILTLSPLLAEEAVFGRGVISFTPVELAPKLTFEIVAQSESHDLRWQLTQKSVGGYSRNRSGNIHTNERFTYMWFQETQTLWFATTRNVEGFTLEDGLSKTSSVVYNLLGYEQIPNIPAEFKKAIAELLKEK